LTESELIERARYGTTIPEAAASILKVRGEELAAAGQSRNAPAATALLISACRMGLHDAAPLQLVATGLGEDPSFASVAEALCQLVLLWQSREPLEAFRLEGLAHLVRAAYERACFLMSSLHGVCDEQEARALDGLRTIASLQDELLDRTLFESALKRVLEDRANTVMAGAAAGLLHARARLSDDALAQLCSGHLGGADRDGARKVGFIRGLLATRREVAWRLPAFLDRVNAMFDGWSDEDFIRALPHLRLAFADLSPREADAVARAIGGDVGPLIERSVSADEVQSNLHADQRVAGVLREDGLGDWATT
jgi:hypothetical protein